MALIEGHVGTLLPLSDLASNLNAEAKRTGQALPRVRFLVGGPLGAVQRLLAESPELGAQLNDVSGQLATWNASSANLFPNQFNVACDPNAAIQLTSKPDCQMNLVTTEYCKTALTFELADIEHDQAIPPVVRQLYALWHGISGRPPRMTVFDVAPLFIPERPSAECLVPMVPVQCTLEDGLFKLQQVGESLVQATPETVEPELSDRVQKLLLQALASLIEFRNLTPFGI